MILHLPRHVNGEKAKLWRRFAPQFPWLEKSDAIRFELFISALRDFRDMEDELEDLMPGSSAKTTHRKSMATLRMNIDKLMTQLGSKTRDKRSVSENGDGEAVDELDAMTGMG